MGFNSAFKGLNKDGIYPPKTDVSSLSDGARLLKTITSYSDFIYI